MVVWLRTDTRMHHGYLAVHDQVADAAGEVFVLQLRVDVGDVLVHTTELEHLAHVQVSKTKSWTQKTFRSNSF